MRTNYKKQFRLYDIYRYAATNEPSHIKGIARYTVNADATQINVWFNDDAAPQNYVAGNEQDRKDIIRAVNKVLNNCNTPGRRRKFV